MVAPLIFGGVACAVIGAVIGAWWAGRDRRAGCARSCGCAADPRCAAGNCTNHCGLYCNGRCLRLWEDAVKRGEIPLPGADGRAALDLSFLKDHSG